MAHVPAVMQCPEPIETASLHFKSLSKVKVFNADGVTFDANTSLVAVSQNFGLTFIGTLNGFLILKSKYVFTAGSNIDQYQREIVLNSKTTHLATDFDDNHLAVACQTKMGPIIYIYNIPSFLTKGVIPIKTVPLSNSFQVNQLCELLWQPNSENGLTVCFTDGSVSSLSLFQGSGNDLFSLPPTTQARCLCWSPKGKQIVIGCNDGSLSQYKPDLKFVKKLSSPPLFNGAVTVVNVLWISNFQFLAAYKDANKQDDFPIIVIVNAPKNEQIRFINYDDITYSSVHFRSHQFYFYHLMTWNLIFVASANSMEVAVIHAKEDNSTWEQWLLGDASRAELPLNSQKSETFPLGFSFDYTSDQAIPWGEESLPPMPRLLILSTEGLLITFNVINTIMNDTRNLSRESRKVFDDSWFAVKEKIHDAAGAPKMNQSFEVSPSQTRVMEMSKPSQNFPSTFAPFTSMSPTPQDHAAATAGTLSLKLQPPKQQVVPPIQQQTQSQILQPQLQIHPGAASIFQNPNSPPKWSQKPPFSFPLTPNSGTTTESASIAINKPNETFKNVDQRVNIFATKPSLVAQLNQSPETKDLVKTQKAPESNVETRTITEQSNTFSTPVSAESKTGRKRTPESSPSRGTPEIAVVDDSVYVTALWDEIDHFNAELKEVISRVSALRLAIGTDDEKASLRNSIEKLNSFQNSLNETTSSQKSEIHAIKTDMMEAFAWLEDARSRNRQRKSPTFIELKKSQDLDPMSSRLMNEINHLKYYIENQLKQLYSYLMKEWMEHQDACRLDIKAMMAIPSMEELYKTMHLELKILSKQRANVEELRRIMKEKSLKNRGDAAILTSSVRNNSAAVDNNRMSELFKLADNLLQIKIDREEQTNEICVMDAFQLMIKNQINAIAERSRKFTPEKQNLLRDILSEREMLKTRSVKSTVTSSSFIRNASSRIYSKALLTWKRKEAEKVSKLSSETSQLAGVMESPTVDGKFTSQTNDKGLKVSSAEPDSPSVGHRNSGNRENTLVSSKSGEQKPAELFTFPAPNSTPVRSVNEKEVSTGVSSEPKTMPFVFKAAPVSPAPVVSSVSVPKSAPATMTVAQTGYGVTVPAESVVISSAASNAGVFAFKFADVASTASTAPTFSFTANKSSFSPRTDVKFSGSIFGAPQTAASEVPPQSAPSTAFSFASSVNKSSAATSSDSIFGNAANLFPFSGSLSKSNSGSSIFSSASPSSDAASAAALTLTTRSKSGSLTPSNVTALAKSGSSLPSSSTFEVGSTTITSTEALGRISLKATTAADFATTATSNAPQTTTTAIISSTITTTASTAAVSSSTASFTITPASPTTGAATEAGAKSEESDTVESEVHVTDESGQEVQEKPEEVKNAVVENDLSGVVTSSTTVPVKTEAESSGTSVLVFPSATTANPSSGIFMVPSSTVSLGIPASNSGSIFGQSVSVASTTTNIFSTTTANIFSPTKTVTTSSALFGTPAAATSTGSIFGQPAQTTASTGNIFGQVTPTTAATTFGQPAKDDVGQTAKLFGDVLGSNLSSRNIFETPTSTATSGSIFGKSSFEKSGGSIFGNASVAATTTATAVAASSASSGIFGSASSNIFSKGLVPQTQMPTSTSSSIFGQPQNTDTGNTFFGQNICNTFGGAINTSANQNPFANATGFNSKPVFGQSLFGQNTTEQNPFERSQSSSIFGGTPSTTQNVFQSSSGSFGGLPPGPFSGTQSTTGQTGIGGASAFQKPMGGNIFGSSPTFTRSGATPTFGGAPTFGSPATFGSPQKVFGSPQGTFGQNQANAPTFGALANQTDGFANLALQSQSQTPAFGGNTFTQSSNFGGESNFGGTSFSSWRS